MTSRHVPGREPSIRTHAQELSSTATRLLLAIAASLGMLLGAAGVAVAADAVELADGHVDAFTVIPNDDGLTLQVKEDITGHGVLRNPEDVVFRVGDAAYSADLASHPDIASSGYVLPLTQVQGLLWPGWDTLEVSPAGFEAIDIVIDQVRGPGTVYLFTQKNFSQELQPLLADGELSFHDGSRIHQATPAHVHAYWMFTEPGVYTFTAHAQGERYGTTVSSPQVTYTWAVGDATAVDSRDLTPAPDSGAVPPIAVPPAPSVPVVPPLPSDPPKKTPSPAPRQAPSGSSSSSGSSERGGHSAQPIHATATVPECRQTSTGTGLVAQLKDDTVHPAVFRDPASVTFVVGERARAQAPAGLQGIEAGSEIYTIGATQIAGVPWLGANTMDEDLQRSTTGEVTWRPVSLQGPGRLEVFTSGNFGQVIGTPWFQASADHLSGEVTIPRNTHVHPNWVFSAPGEYLLTVEQSATSTDGHRMSATTTLRFLVGKSAGTAAGRQVNEGHFDLGATIRDGVGTWTLPDGTPCSPGASDQPTTTDGHGSQLASTGVASPLWALILAALGLLSIGAALLHGWHTGTLPAWLGGPR
ncbi:TIGR03773 family transporter-associated surface protein [Corynebacterium sp. 13CS0277]|uniref:TIGR03773 family transporter-associated surface protein n=1 Tax=Corynebacterium sp. 13CS0277 TaxID=2071994 RepID=UPI001304C107|nr:TIGR03773 family transporter-associated surface protein [Corynebacterium sp. 13CS0277]